jgi:[ribosomal protein S5]-alanine N-acetyltransferase
MARVPTLTTERLVLRPMAEEHLDAFAALTADLETMRWLGSEAIDRAETWRRLAYHVGHWELRGFGHWAVELRGSGEFAGNAGLYRPEGWPGIEVGWTLAPEHRGRGYATEAARAAVEWGWRELGLDRVISLIRPENERSAAVARRLGMTDSGERFDFHGHQHVVWELRRPGAVGG